MSLFVLTFKKLLLVYGALLGRQKGRFIELCTSFEIKMNQNTDNEQIEDIDLEFLNTNISQCKKIKSIILKTF